MVGGGLWDYTVISWDWGYSLFPIPIPKSQAQAQSQSLDNSNYYLQLAAYFCKGKTPNRVLCVSLFYLVWYSRKSFNFQLKVLWILGRYTEQFDHRVSNWKIEIVWWQVGPRTHICIILPYHEGGGKYSTTALDVHSYYRADKMSLYRQKKVFSNPFNFI